MIFRGKLLAEQCRDPECDAARALLAKGFTGKLTLLDSKTGLPRTVIDIEKAADLRVSEENRDGLRFRRYVNPAIAPPAAESDDDEGGRQGWHNRPPLAITRLRQSLKSDHA